MPRLASAILIILGILAIPIIVVGVASALKKLLKFLKKLLRKGGGKLPSLSKEENLRLFELLKAYRDLKETTKSH
ncbi:hypothetical protein AGMMS49975_11010 [Clostridia bacterium]|nr:hypothetical protein AGMMS49975_11010 [Clostridia bacterium]